MISRRVVVRFQDEDRQTDLATSLTLSFDMPCDLADYTQYLAAQLATAARQYVAAEIHAQLNPEGWPNWENEELVEDS